MTAMKAVSDRIQRMCAKEPRTFSRYVPAIILLAATQAVFAWGREGHIIVADIAASRLSEEANAKLQELLDLEPEPKHRNLRYASLWPDLIKNHNHPDHEAYKYARSYHYVNYPKGEDTYVGERDCRDGACVIEAIRSYENVLRYSPDPKQRLIALKFLVHFVTDVHQPLHVGYKHDRGGNDVSVRFFNQKTNLHRVWDTLMLRRDGASGKKLTAYGQKLGSDISKEEGRRWIAATDPAVWADEARQYVSSPCYGLLPSSGQLGDEYHDACLPVVKEQLQKAGVRLAAVLNQLLTEEEPSGCSCGSGG